jgi:hypothetical protein
MIFAMFASLFFLPVFQPIALFILGDGSQKPSPLVVCPACKRKTSGRLRRSFLGFRYQKCLHCQNKINLPLSWSFRIVYLAVVVFLFMGLVDPVTRRVDNPLAALFIMGLLVVFFIDIKTAVSMHKSEYSKRGVNGQSNH